MELRSVQIQCPWCWELYEALVDDSVGEQAYVEDCQVCCHPIVLEVQLAGDGEPLVVAKREGD